MTTVYFVRHAEPNYSNHDDELRELTEKGLEDRKLVTEYLSDKSIDIILSSPYKRAVDTIMDFAKYYNHTIETIYDFRERKVDSVWIEDFTTFCKNQWRDFNYKYTDGETLAEVQKRNITALNLVLEEYTAKNIVIGSHGTALCTIINYYDSKFVYEDFEKIRCLMPWIVKFTFEGKQLITMESINVFEG
ncbi:histidine phosphatase family protein [Anaerosporobacter sp.]